MSTGEEEREEQDILLEKEQPPELGTKTPEQIVEEYRTKGNPISGGSKLTVEMVNKARQLWGLEGLDKGSICTTLGLGMNVVSDCVKGIMRAKPPGSRVDVPGMLTRAGIPVIESPVGKGTSLETSTLKVAQPRPQPRIPAATYQAPSPAISPDAISSLYALAVQRGFATLDDFIFKEMIPWYGVKMNWEWRIQGAITPKEFERLLDDITRKAALLEQAQDQVQTLSDAISKEVAGT